jgi:hypothetical protein
MLEAAFWGFVGGAALLLLGLVTTFGFALAYLLSTLE